MDGIFVELVKEIPAIVAILIIIVMFNKTLTSIADKFMMFVNEQSAKYDGISEKSNSVIERNSILYGQILEVMRKIRGEKKYNDNNN